MRTQQKDIRRTTTLTTINPVVDGASGSGAFSDGTPWAMVRTATGEYTLYFDTRLFLISGSIGPRASGRHFYKFEAAGAGQVKVQVLDSTGTAENSANFDVTITCIDTRV